LQNATYCSISASPLSGICQQAQILTRHRTLVG